MHRLGDLHQTESAERGFQENNEKLLVALSKKQRRHVFSCSLSEKKSGSKKREE
jgi:hypothetical protein